MECRKTNWRLTLTDCLCLEPYLTLLFSGWCHQNDNRNESSRILLHPVFSHFSFVCLPFIPSCSRIDDDMGRTHELEHSAIKCMRGILYCYMRQADKVRLKPSSSCRAACLRLLAVLGIRGVFLSRRSSKLSSGSSVTSQQTRNPADAVLRGS